MTSVDINRRVVIQHKLMGKADVEALGLDKLDLVREGKAEETLSQPFLSFPIHNCPEKEMSAGLIHQPVEGSRKKKIRVEKDQSGTLCQAMKMPDICFIFFQINILRSSVSFSVPESVPFLLYHSGFLS